MLLARDHFRMHEGRRRGEGRRGRDGDGSGRVTLHLRNTNSSDGLSDGDPKGGKGVEERRNTKGERANGPTAKGVSVSGPGGRGGGHSFSSLSAISDSRSVRSLFRLKGRSKPLRACAARSLAGDRLQRRGA